jgi:hypothetical protein
MVWVSPNFPPAHNMTAEVSTAPELVPQSSTIHHTRTMTQERLTLAAQRDMHPNLLQRIMDTRTMRKAPWLVYVFIFLVATGIAVMCIRFKLGDDMTAIIVAVLTCTLILSTGVCLWFSLRSGNPHLSSEAVAAAKKKKKKRITVTLKAHYHENNSDETSTLVCPICLVDIVKGDRLVKLECDHLFHVGCISSWISRKAQCPACRFNIPTVISSCSSSARTTPGLPPHSNPSTDPPV